MFTLHGAVMVFLFIIPSIPAALGNFVLPLMLGAKDVAFPRMNLLSFWLWVVGRLFCIGAVVAGGVDTGWTFYTPYSTTTNTNVVATTLRRVHPGLLLDLHGMNFIVTIHKLRPPGMTWFKMPLFLWSLYGTAIIQVLATPVLAITLLLLIAERTLGVGIFDPALGGDPVLFQHFFWFYSHPAVYIMILPAMGIISEVISIHSRKHIFGYRFIALSSIAIAAFGSSSGATICSSPASPDGERHLLGADVFRGDPVGDQGVQLAGHPLQGGYPPHDRDDLRP
jgi:cytochrome c oxidase subunit 1